MTAPDWATSVPSTPGVHNPPPPSAQWENLSQDEINSLRSKLLESIQQVIVQSLTGGLNANQPASTQLTNWADSLPILGPIITALTNGNVAPTAGYAGLQSFFNFGTGTTQIMDLLNQAGTDFITLIESWIPGYTSTTQAQAQTDLNQVIQNILKMLGFPPSPPALTASSFDPVSAGSNMLQDVLTPAGALSSYTMVPSHLFGWLSPGGQAGTNLLPDGSFNDPTSLQGNGLWTFDATVDNTGTPGSGSAMATAAGALRELLCVPIVTAPGATVHMEGNFKWSGLSVAVASAASFQIVGNAYDANDVFISTTPVNEVHNPTAASSGICGTDILGLPLTANGNGFVWLQGNFTAPANTRYIRFGARITANANVGTAHVDDCVHTVSTGIIDTGNVIGLPPLQSNVDTHLANVAAQTGSTGTDLVTAALQALQLQSNLLQSVAAQLQQQKTMDSGATNSGLSMAIYFANYSNWSQVPVTTTYGNVPGQSSHGSGHFIIDSNGRAAWSPVSDGDVSGICIYNPPSGPATTQTVYQEMQASLAGLPNGGNSKNFGIVRANSVTNPTDYVFGDIFLQTDFTLHYELGCYIGGTRYLWATGPVNTINLNFTFIAGVGNNPNRYQGYSGTQLVFDHTNVSGDPGGLYPVDLSHIYWGFRSDTFNSGQNYPAPANYVGCADNAPPTVPGSGVRMYRTQTASIAQNTAMGLNNLACDGVNQFFDAVSEQSSDMTVVTTNIGSFYGTPSSGGTAGVQVANAGRYSVGIRADLSVVTVGTGAVSICPAVVRYNSAGVLQETKLFPTPAFCVNGFGGQYNAGFFGGAITLGCQAGDILQPGYYLNPGAPNNAAGNLSNLGMTGDLTGSHAYFEVTLANWSFN